MKKQAEPLQNVRRYCLCGAAWTIKGNVPGTANLIDFMEREHTGEGHGEATQKQAARARAGTEKDIGGWED